MGFECPSGICLSGECFEPSVSVDCIVDADCEEDEGEVCSAGECFRPDLVGYGPDFFFCTDDSDCFQAFGEYCDGFRCATRN